MCEFDEYELDTPHNRALKSVIVLLLRHGDVAAPRRAALRRLLPYLDAVTLIAPTSIRWCRPPSCRREHLDSSQICMFQKTLTNR